MRWSIWTSLAKMKARKQVSNVRYRFVPGLFVSRRSEVCFGDFHTRAGLDLRTRELLVLCVLCALGDTERQIKSHAISNLKVGNSLETIISCTSTCRPVGGIPFHSPARSPIRPRVWSYRIVVGKLPRSTMLAKRPFLNGISPVRANGVAPHLKEPAW
jgi:alkylhydroperoxidase/carboxymuconolactone decarboxylase family protein YurZ